MAKKIILDCEDILWDDILKYRINKSLKNNNEAVLEFIKKRLKTK